MTLYVLIDILILAVPLALSFDRRVSFVRQWPAAFGALLPVGVFYLWEDVAAAAKGSWSFAERWSGTAQLLGLPAGEWLFFLVVPYACLFLYACVRGYIPEKQIRFSPLLFAAAAAAAFAGAWIFRDQPYTVVVLAVFGASCLSSAVFRPDLIRSRQYWIAMGISFAAFLVVNGILTSVPVVIYDPTAVWGLRLWTIPLEDFFYNFAYLNFVFVLFRVVLDSLALRSGAGKGPVMFRPRSVPRNGAYSGPGGVGSLLHPPAAYRFLEKHREP